METGMWIDVSQDDRKLCELEKERQHEQFKQSICHSFLSDMPPLKHFIGWTPIKDYISRCKPFIPMQRSKPLIAQSVLSGDLMRAVEQMQLANLEHWKWIQKTLQIPKENIGYERK